MLPPSTPSLRRHDDSKTSVLDKPASSFLALSHNVSPTGLQLPQIGLAQQNTGSIKYTVPHFGLSASASINIGLSVRLPHYTVT